MNTQDSVNQILGMAMIGGKLSGAADARANRKLANTISSIDTEINSELKDLQKTAQDTRIAFRKDPNDKTSHDAIKAEATYGRRIQETESTRLESQRLKKELMLKDPTKENIEAVVAGERSIERAKMEVEHSIVRRQNIRDFLKKSKGKAAGGTP